MSRANPVMLAFLHERVAMGAEFRAFRPTPQNYVSNDNNIEGSNNWVGRIDYNLNTKNRIFYRAIIGSGDATAYAGDVFGEYFQTAAQPPGKSCGGLDRHSHQPVGESDAFWLQLLPPELQ